MRSTKSLRLTLPPFSAIALPQRATSSRSIARSLDTMWAAGFRSAGLANTSRAD